MSEPTEDQDVVVYRITIERRLTEEDLTDFVTTEDADGERLPITTALGMLTLAEHSIITAHLYEDEDDDE